MPTEVIMPQLGESVVEGTITRWLKAKGDPVEEFEPLLEVNTDKVDTEVPSPTAGVLLEILVPEGTTVKAGTQLAWIGEVGEAPPAGEGQPGGETQPAGETQPNGKPAGERAPAAPVMESGGWGSGGSEGGGSATPVAPAPGRDRNLGFISPVVARIASEQNIDLFAVPGTGQGGRITKRDLMAYLEQRKAAPAEAAAPAPATTVQAPPAAPEIQPARERQVEAAAPATAPAAPVFPAEQEGDELLPMTPVRRAIAEHMVFSKRTSPHVTTVMEADLSRIVAHRQANKGAFAKDGVNLTFTAYFVAAAVAALKAYPIVNSSWSDDGILLHRDIHIGMATSLGEGGLIVPVIKHADSLSLLGLARTVNDLANRARNRQLKPDEVKGGTFTITNHGTSGSLFATPVINQPQCGILGVGAVQKRVVVVDDMIAIRPMVYLSLTFDHRILDGAVGDAFLGKVVEYLQNWQG